MGIPHLTSHLRPYAEVVSPLQDQHVVIDGPAMAYQIYHSCLALRPESKNPFEAAPTYQELGEAVILWLDFLKSHQLRIKKIFFDGFLPSSKNEVRISRLDGLTKQLKTYSIAHQPAIPSSKQVMVRNLKSKFLLSLGKISSAATKIPPATFQVPAIIEALLSSDEYASLVQVVPDEADIFCAGYVQEHGGLILTGDSDLLVHDLGPTGSVVFFRDLEVTETSGRYDLKCLQYQPSAIAKRLEIISLRSLGFAISMDSHATFPQLLQRSKDMKYVSKHTELYEAFVRNYDAPIAIQDSIFNALNSSETSRILQMLHPRLSEFVLQFPYFSSIAWSSFNLANRNIRTLATPTKSKEIFLPFILDSPIRTSAWDPSTAIRLTAYSLLNIVVPNPQQLETVIERRRQENGSIGRKWMLPSSTELVQALQTMLDVFRQLQEKLGLGSERGNGIALWRAYATYLDLENAEGKGKTALSESQYQQYHRRNKTDGKYEVSWETIHHIAQLQATYYSLRILKQILDLVLSIPIPAPEDTITDTEVSSNSNANSRTPSVPGIKVLVQDLHAQLASPSPLASLPSFNEEREKLGSSDIERILKVAKGILGIGIEDEKTNPKEADGQGKRKKKSRKSRGENGKKRRGNENVAGMSDNPFSALMME